MIFFQILTRIVAFVRTELVQVIRRPSTVLSLIVGPFLIMAIFGLGYEGLRPTVRAIVVVPPGSGLPTDVQSYDERVPGVQVVAVMPTPDAAEAALRNHEDDAVIIYPADLRSNLSAGKQSTITVEVSLVNPNDVLIATDWANQLSTWTNQAMIQAAVASGDKLAPPSVKKIPPEVVAQPTKAELRNLSPVNSGVVPYFGPSVLILILQHLCVTLVALSLLLERKSGIFELYRVGPVSAWEIIVGKLLAYLIIGAIIGAVTLGLLIYGLHVPVMGNIWDVAATLGLVLAASIGVGLLLGAIVDSDRTAVQMSLLVLLASIFFSGFILDLALFFPPVQTAAQAIPATQGIVLLHRVLLSGSVGDPTPLGILGAIAIVSILGSWLLMRRAMAAAR
jgi:ABC-2 type transport system permease protein